MFPIQCWSSGERQGLCLKKQPKGTSLQQAKNLTSNRNLSNICATVHHHQKPNFEKARQLTLERIIFRDIKNGRSDRNSRQISSTSFGGSPGEKQNRPPEIELTSSPSPNICTTIDGNRGHHGVVGSTPSMQTTSSNLRMWKVLQPPSSDRCSTTTTSMIPNWNLKTQVPHIGNSKVPLLPSIKQSWQVRYKQTATTILMIILP